jgi:hypothetical protein
LSDESRKGNAARPVGEEKYALVKHQNRAELVYLEEVLNEFSEIENFLTKDT